MPMVQATEVTYELHTLGWKAFQNLCATIVGEVWTQTVSGYLSSNDGGRDGAFRGTGISKDGRGFDGTFTVQCKFTSKRDKLLTIGDLDDELSKAARLAKKGIAQNYLLFTNAGVSGKLAEELEARFLSIRGIRRFEVYGCDRISQIIRETPRLRMLVPRIYGLGDLSQILDERAYAQAREILSVMGDDLSKIVITDAYKRSAKAVVNHGFVLLLGEPASGKSTIAASLAMGSLDEWRCSTVKVRTAEEFVRHWNPNEPKQFFWVDDAFGTTQFDFRRAEEWNQAFPYLQSAINRGAKVVFTSRDYIYKSATRFLKKSSFPLLDDSQVTIYVERLTSDEKDQILYNHIRRGTQPPEFKRTIKAHLPSIATNSRFSPEIARRLGNMVFTRALEITPKSLKAFVEQPMALLGEIVRTLDKSSYSALALIFMRGGTFSDITNLTPEEENALRLLGGAQAEVREALNSLQGSLVNKSLELGEVAWHFKHPTIRDAFAAQIAEDSALMDIYLAGAPIERLFDEVSCGDLKIPGVKVIVPPSRFDIVLARLTRYGVDSLEKRSAVYWFLGTRCSKEFLSRYIQAHTDFVDSIEAWPYLNVVPDTRVILRLREFGLLPEQKRIDFVKGIRKLAVETPDSTFLEPDIRELLTFDEYAQIINDVRHFLIPRLADTFATWESNYSTSEDVDSYLGPLRDALTDYNDEMQDDELVTTAIAEGLIYLDNLATELRREGPREPDDDYFDDDGYREPHTPEPRSIFDDVDS